MSWDTEIITTVRVLINDIVSPYTYSDDRLKQVVTVAAKFVKNDLSFISTDYSINIIDNTISPDPTAAQSLDEVFVNCVSLKASCIVDQSTFRTKAASEGIKATLGPASLDIRNNLQGFKILLDEGPCALYNKFVNDYEIANATNIRAILSPFVGNNFTPDTMHNSGLGYRDFYS